MVCSGCNLPCCLLFCSGSGEDSLDRLLPPAGPPRRKSATSLSKTEPPLLRTGTRTIYTAGRPPWYDEHGAQSKEAFVIGMTLTDDVFTPLGCFLRLRLLPSCQVVALSCRTCAFVPFCLIIHINTCILYKEPSIVNTHIHCLSCKNKPFTSSRQQFRERSNS